MDDRVTFRLNRRSYPAYMALKEWCRVNRVPMGRLFNTILEHLYSLPNYNESGHDTEIHIVIPLPKQTDIDDRLRYLTRVKMYG